MNNPSWQLRLDVPLRVFRIGDRVANDILQEDLQDATRLLIDQTRDTLDTTTTSKTTNSLQLEGTHYNERQYFRAVEYITHGFRDTLDVVSQNLPVTLGATLSETLHSIQKSFRFVVRVGNCWRN